MPYSYIIHVLDTYRSVYLLFPASQSITALYYLFYSNTKRRVHCCTKYTCDS